MVSNICVGDLVKVTSGNLLTIGSIWKVYAIDRAPFRYDSNTGKNRKVTDKGSIKIYLIDPNLRSVKSSDAVHTYIKNVTKLTASEITEFRSNSTEYGLETGTHFIINGSILYKILSESKMANSLSGAANIAKIQTATKGESHMIIKLSGAAKLDGTLELL